ncbi:MAG: biotin/lipoyl-containing protein [Candidatus Krumholzibacteriia bacterium]
MKMRFTVRVEGQEKRLEVEERDGVYRLDIDGKSQLVDCHSAGHRDFLSLIIDNKSHLIESAPLKMDEGLYYAKIGGRRYNVEVLDERLLATRQATAIVLPAGPYVITSPMPGLIVDVRVKVGDTVEAGTAVVVMEAMKMQNELVSEVQGVVTAVNIQTSDTVDSQAPLVEIERSE